MKKIAIVTFHTSLLNYGALLQAHSLQKALKDNQYDAKIIDYKPSFIPKHLNDKRSLKGKIAYLIKNSIFNNYESGLEKRVSKNISFRNGYLDVVPVPNNDFNSFDSIIVGSDQVWNPVLTKNDVFYFLKDSRHLNKISYAASCGSGLHLLPLFENELKSFSYISVRENSVCDKLSKMDIQSVKVCDPVLLNDKTYWESIIKPRRHPKKYILVHIVAKEEKTISFAKNMAKKYKAKLIILNKKILFSKKTLNDCGPLEFLGMVKNAMCVVTTSYHAALFSLIFNRPLVFEKSTNSDRFDNIVNDYLINNCDISNINDYTIPIMNWSYINNQININRRNSLKFLNDSINNRFLYSRESVSEKKIAVTRSNICTEFDEKHCCGCSACSSICQKNAIQMVRSKKGFYIPEVNRSMCVNCGMCIKVCNYKKFEPNTIIPLSFAVRNKSLDEVKRSRSGAFFPSLCGYVLSNQGVVFGCEINKKMLVHHVFAETTESMNTLRKSKYVQSDLKVTFKQCREFLIKNKYVLFSGTGCQIHGLLSYLHLTNTPTEHLITCDIICHGVASPKVWEDFIKTFEKNSGESILDVDFRDKNRFGWKSHKESYLMESGKTISGEFWSRAYKEGIMLNESCYHCPYTTPFRESDFTIGDYWSIKNNSPKFDDDLGVNHVLVHSEKGKNILNKLDDLNIVSTNLLTSLQEQLKTPTAKRKGYDLFWEKYFRDPDKCFHEFMFKKQRNKSSIFSKINMFFKGE